MIAVRPGRIGGRGGRNETAPPPPSQPITFPAPIGGLITSTDMASAAAGSASILRNFFPTLTGCRIRGGSIKRGLAEGGGNILSAFKYKYGTIERMFMATATGIFEMTSPAPPPASIAAVVSGMHGGDWCTFMHANAGNAYLVCLNGADDRRLFNGTMWTTTPAITFTDGTVSGQLNCGWLFKNREFFLKNGTLDAYYLAVNAIGGAASVFPLGGVMKKGGSLITGFSWSIESGNGLSDMCAFVSTEGEVAVYGGSDPSDANDFSLQGVYQIGKPLGKNCWIRAGGDVLLATVDGLMPMSQVFSRDQAAMTLVSASRPIDDVWRLAATATGGGWMLKQWQEQNLVFVSFPPNPVVADATFVLNVLTGKWSTVSNWHATCFETLQGGLFFGSLGGYCWQGDVAGTDDGSPFSAVYLSQFIPVGGFGQRSVASLAHMYFRGKTKPAVKLFARADMDVSEPSFAKVSSGDATSSEWDVGLWDVAIWNGLSTKRKFDFRQNVRATGDTLALGCVIVSGGVARLDIDVDLGTMQVAGGEASA